MIRGGRIERWLVSILVVTPVAWFATVVMALLNLFGMTVIPWVWVLFPMWIMMLLISSLYMLLIVSVLLLYLVST